MNTTPALYVQPSGHTEPFYLHGEPKRQQCDIADELEGPVTAWRLGRHMTVHTATPAYERTRNEIVRAAWRDLAGGSAPDLRGPAIITGPKRRDGLLQPLPHHSFERVQYWARLRHSAAVRRRPQVSAAQHIGTRDLQCDAHAAHRFPDSGRWAFVVLDGIGDEVEVQDHVRTWAPALARRAACLGDPAEAIRQVRAKILAGLRGRRWFYLDPGAVAVVAVYDPADPLLRLAWSGDARAYRLSHIGTIEPLTKDHNWAQELLDAGREPKAWDHNSVTANLEDGVIGSAEVDIDVVAQLVLCSDGVYHPLETHEPGLLEEAALLALDAKDSAASLVAEALAQGRMREATCDNATALVVKFPR
ncbi:PP2C family protein-serine/threonine phosphatase [Actinacidiphila soli]|uniref:PP2C family protein-serine/threonine phosphatase n=1 Tax=Actinacidiphila soli TaxID=2487275 RepID=UPI000FCA56D0|nr:SpoIIE family protein phosphatase [Actinacidiphila soli]